MAIDYIQALLGRLLHSSKLLLFDRFAFCVKSLQPCPAQQRARERNNPDPVDGLD
jgi:hypothetical protein